MAGDGVVELDGRTLRVVRDGKGKSRLDLAFTDPPSDGEISLKDLRAALEARGESSIELQVRTKLAGGQDISFSVDINPDAAMGRQGRAGDFKSAIENMSPREQLEASLYQLMTLPDSDKQAGRETSERLRLAVKEAGGFTVALSHLDGRFGLHADQALLDEAIAHIVKWPELQTLPEDADAAQKQISEKAFEIATNLIRVAGTAMGDPSRVSDKYFELAASCVLGANIANRYDFLNNAFERLDDSSLIKIVRQTDSGADIDILLKQGRLERLVDVAPDLVIYHGLTYALTEDEWKRVLSSELDSVLGSWEARGTLTNPTLTSDDLFRETIMRDPVASIELYRAHGGLGSLHYRIDDSLLGQLAEAAPNTAVKYVYDDLNEAQQERAIALADTVQIAELAAAWEFLPTTKRAKEYEFASSTADMGPMSYAVASGEEEVVTVTASGVETRNTATAGDVIMSGPSGERYVVKATKFAGLYDGEVGDTVIPNQSPRMVKQYDGESVVFDAPWGERMLLQHGDYVVSDGPDAFYRIGEHEFEETYETYHLRINSRRDE
jgi:hypothetical protein